MQIIIYDDAQQVAKSAATWVKAIMDKSPTPVLGLATGSTPILLYSELVQLYQHKQISFEKVATFNLDEYYAIDGNNPQSYRSFMNRHLFDHVDIDVKNTFLPTCSHDENPREKGLAYEDKIKIAGGIDLQILGIGANGHIGFNEPTSSLSSRTRIKSLTQQTLVDNSRLFKPDEWQPSMAMTMGIATIMESRYVILMATGKNKAKAVKEMITGAVTSMCPASILQMHENAVILLDKEAACELKDQQYFMSTNQLNNTITEKFGLFYNY